jgi:hypothetical protein
VIIAQPTILVDISRKYLIMNLSSLSLSYLLPMVIGSTAKVRMTYTIENIDPVI